MLAHAQSPTATPAQAQNCLLEHHNSIIQQKHAHTQQGAQLLLVVVPA